ncbi:MAG: SGNH/GDSL hydrolase family protein [Candidatus Omnitrophica bacterium]|nr:SGNH/GDSL hydrolase family protein [Candidatus Omnitrophota bacterium]
MKHKNITFLFQGRRFSLSLGGKLCLLVISICFALMIAELAVRVFVKVPLKKEYMRFASLNYAFIPEAMRDKELLWLPRKYIRQTKYQKDNNSRIICIGDSNTEGHSSLRIEQTYPYALEKIFKQEGHNKTVEIINAGSSGYSSFQGLAYLRKEIYKYEPDLVISWFGVQDSSCAWFYEDKAQDALEYPDDNNSLMNSSRFYLFIKNFFFLSETLRKKIPRVLPQDYMANCREMLKISKEKGFKMAFIVPFHLDLKKNKVFYYEEYKELLLSLEKETDCLIIDVVPYLFGKNIKELFLDSCHPSGKGNDFIAGIVFNDLKHKQLFN